MNAKNLNFMMIFVFFSLLLSCEKDEMENNSVIPVIHDYRIDNVLYGKNSRLKHIYLQGGFNAEYKYDKSNRISRINYGVDIHSYDIYQYNIIGKLEKISSYTAYPENSPVLTHTVVYSYDATGIKEKEQTDFTDNRETVYNLYKYSGGKLTKQEHYEGNQQTYYIVYEYKDDTLVMEKFYVPGEKDFVTTEYFYEEGLHVYSITYNGNPKSGFGSDKRMYYDKNNNLVKRVDNIPGLSSYSGATAFHVTWEYKYE